VLAGTLAALAGLATRLAAGLATLATHHLVLASGGNVVAAGILAVLAGVATVATSVGHFIFRAAIFFTRVGKEQTASRPKATPNLQLGVEDRSPRLQNDPRPLQRQEVCSRPLLYFLSI